MFFATYDAAFEFHFVYFHPIDLDFLFWFLIAWTKLWHLRLLVMYANQPIYYFYIEKM